MQIYSEEHCGQLEYSREGLTISRDRVQILVKVSDNMGNVIGNNNGKKWRSREAATVKLSWKELSPVSPRINFTMASALTSEMPKMGL